MKRIVSGLLVLAVYWSMFVPFAAVANAQAVTNARNNRMKDIPEGLTFRLSEGAEGADARVEQTLSPSDPLSRETAEDILKRLPTIKSDPSDQTDFAKRVGSLPPPKTGRQIPVKFPSDEERGTPKIDPGTTLQVVRYSPEGDVPLAPDLSVTFSQPMVAVTSQDQAAQYKPVALSPPVEGRWRWLGTRTLMFDTEKRFPMATRFTARVPAGTKAANGQTLAKDVVWTFTTPPPKVEQMIPNGQVSRRDAVIFVSFDQAIDPGAVLATISVTGSGRVMATRLATEDEIASDANIAYHSKQAQPGRWLAFRAINADGSVENALPPASTITVSVKAGTPSAEGPLKTQKAQNFSFTTYGPFKFSKAVCGWEQNKTCSPFHDWYLEFNNPIDATKFTKELVKVEPAIEGLNIFPSGNHIYFQGYKKGRTNYTITVDASLTDTFGQKLDRAVSSVIRVGAADQNLYAQGGPMVVLDPFGSRSFSVYTTNFSSVRVRLYVVEPKDWNQYQQYYRRLNYDDGKRPAVPGRALPERVVQIASQPDELVETRIDISEALKNGFGNVIVEVEPTTKPAVPRGRNWRVVSWLQSTQLGLDAFVDNTELVAFATELKTGKPMSGVELTIYPNAAVSSQQSGIGQKEEGGWIDWAWALVTGSGGPGATDIESYDAEGVEVESEAVAEAQSNITGANGVLRLVLPDSQPAQSILVARRGDDVAFLPENSDYVWQDTGNWYRKTESDSLRWFVFDDRKMYRPKEEVAVKGYIRRVTAGKLGDIEGLGDAASGLAWSVKDPRNNEIASGTGNLNAFGAFDFKFILPDNANLGFARIDLSTKSGLPGDSYSHQFQIQEFRRPEFEVRTKVESEAPHFVGGRADLSVEAKYYAGGGLANAETNWTVTATPTNYTPPNRDDFTFGTWVPWWRTYDYVGLEFSGRGPRGGGTTQTFKGVTDAAGRHLLKIDFQSVKPPRPYSVSASASVQDVNRQTWSSTSTLLVHPADLYVGIRTPRTFVQKGEKIVVESIVTDLDGKLLAGRDVDIKAVLKDWQFDKGAWKEVTVDEQVCAVKSADAPVNCEFVAKQGGRYTITATVMDDRERFNESEFTVWVPGGKQPPKRNVEREEVQIIPSKKDLAPGDVAELLVIAPFTPAEGILTLRRDGIVKTERFSMKDSSVTLKIPLEEKYLPNIYAQVDLVGAATRTNDKGETDPKLSQRPAFASGNINLPISTALRRLNVSAEPADKTLVPGGETKVTVDVKDHDGNAVANSEIAVVIVDESVLALSNYRIADPVSIFYMARNPGVTDHHSRQDVVLGNPDDVKAPPPPAGLAAANEAVAFASMPDARPTGSLAAQRSKAGLLADAERDATALVEQDSLIALRQNFNALAVFAPSVRTDSNGRAVVDVKLPDNLTRYRITAVSVDPGKRFGIGESSITAKQPLMVRPSAPRFMNFGDKIDLPVVVQNQTDQDMTVDVAVRATGAELSVGNANRNAGLNAGGADTLGTARVSASARRIVVKANSREEVRFPAAAVSAGTARFQFAATSGKFSDAAEISLPVWTPATTEAFATYGTTDQDGAIIQPVQTPPDVYSQFGGLEVTTSSTQLQELTDAFIYLANYPYECSEQVASRMISIAAMRDVLDAFKAKDMPSAKELEARFARDVEILQSRQRDDGSFGQWKRDRERYEYPFLTVHVAHALVLAKAKGYRIPDEMLNKTKPYLKNVEKHFNDEWHKNSPQVRWTISAYALYVRDLMGDKDAAKAKKILAESAGRNPGGTASTPFEKMPFEALGWILSVLANDPGSSSEVDSIVRFLLNRTTETASIANFVTDYGDAKWLIMYSNRRADGVLLEALIKTDQSSLKNSPGVQAVINMEPEGSSRGPDYTDLIPKLVRGLLAHRTKGHWGSTQENVFILLALDKYFNAFEKVTPDFVTRVWLGSAYAGEEAFKGRSVDSNVLTIPMSYLTQQNGAANLLIDRQGAGRLYYRVGMKYAPKNLKLEPADYGFTILRKYEALDNAEDVKQNSDGSWTIKSGARVRVRLTMVAQARRYHVALVDNLPAGLEILNPGLAVTEAIPPDIGGNTDVMTYGSRSFGHGWYYWRQYWFDHQNFRDERAEAFSALLWEGVYNYTYVARATTPGEFVVPPAKAEEMYAPETFGRTGTDFVRVE
ncbi:MAG TPA: alpha-2-macroglobulin family protein [Pyrinomonadaceae bacterium]